MEIYKGYSTDDIDDLMEEAGDCIYEVEEGTLLDNILFYCPRYGAFVAAIEYPTTEWTSAYMVYIGAEEEIYSVWEKLVKTPVYT